MPHDQKMVVPVSLLLLVLLVLPLTSDLSAQQDKYELLRIQVVKLYKERNFTEGISVAQQAVAIAEKTFGYKHQNVALMIAYLAGFHQGAGHLSEAERFFKQALDIYDGLDEKDDLIVASVLDQIASLYTTEPRLTEAEPLLKRALAIYETKLGPDHANVAVQLGILGKFYLDNGNYKDAELCYQKSISIKEKIFGPTNKAVADSLAHLAQVYRSANKYPDAEATYNRVLGIEELNLGKSNLELADWLNLVGEVFREDHKFPDAEHLFERALSIVELSPNRDNSRLAHSLTELASTYGDEKEFELAEPLMIRALDLREKKAGTDPRTLATTLCNLAMLYAAEGKHLTGAPLFDRALDLWRRFLLPTYQEFAESLSALVPLYANAGRYHEIETDLKDTISDIEIMVHTSSPVVQATTHSNFAKFLEGESKYEEAERLYRRALAINNKLFVAGDSNVAVSSHNLARVLREEGKYTEAEVLDRQALAVFERSTDPISAYIPITLNNLGVVVQRQGRYREAETLFRQALTIMEKTPNDLGVSVALFNLGKLYFEEDRYEEAEALYKQSLTILHEHALTGSVQYIRFQAELSAIHMEEGKYAEAESEGLTALHALEGEVGPDHPAVAYSSLILAETYARQSKYKEADEFERRAVNISRNTLGANDPDLAIALDRMATFYDLEGNFVAAEPLAEDSLRIDENIFGENHPAVAHEMNELANLYREHKRFDAAETLSRQALKIADSGTSSSSLLAESLSGLAGVYKDEGRFAEAEQFYLKAMKTAQTASPGDPTAVAATVTKLAALYYSDGKLSFAEPLLKRAVKMIGDSAGPDDPDLATVISTLAGLYYKKGIPEQAQPLFARSLSNLSHQFAVHFSYMSEKQRLLFLQMVSYRFSMFFSFCLTYHSQYPATVGDMYDVLLWEKGLVARSVAMQRARLDVEGGAESVTLINQLAAKEMQFAELHTVLPKDQAQWNALVNRLEEETEALQRELARRSSEAGDEKASASVGWRDVQKALAKDEAVVEFVRFVFATNKGKSGVPYYVAVVLTPEMSSSPALVPLGPANVIEGPAIAQYRRSARLDKKSPLPDSLTFYDAVWRPLEPFVAGKKRIYVSTDGVLNQVSLAVVSDGRSLLIEKYDLTMVSSTSDLLRQKHHSSNRSAVLIGNPRFDLGEIEYRAALTTLRAHDGAQSVLSGGETSGKPNMPMQSGSIRPRSHDQGGVLDPLPGTKDELTSARCALEKNGWQVQVYTEERALKEVLVVVRGPRILHIATHGFFRGDQERNLNETMSDDFSQLEDPMLRSGLYLAGADRVLNGVPPVADLGDGVLTAYEARGLNLHGTELVILSACDTGLGELKNGEGVFGLRRALEEAGAEAVLMSMWSVPDIETQELMTLFYEKWLAGEDKQRALQEAELAERKKVKDRWGKDRPDLWGAFVMIGR